MDLVLTWTLTSLDSVSTSRSLGLNSPDMFDSSVGKPDPGGPPGPGLPIPGLVSAASAFVRASNAATLAADLLEHLDNREHTDLVFRLCFSAKDILK